MAHIRHGTGAGQSGRALARLGTVALGVAGTALVGAVVLAPPASAAAPQHQACLGHDIRGYAQMGSGFGGFVVQTADGGAGQEIQAHLAGWVPDAAVPNSCND